MNVTEDVGCKACGFCFSRAIKAGFIATLVMTFAMIIMGMNSMKMLGELALNPGSSELMVYLAGAAIHFGFGLIYGLIYALISAPMPFDAFLKVVIYSVLLSVISYFGFPFMVKKMNEMKPASMMGGMSEGMNSGEGDAMIEVPMEMVSDSMMDGGLMDHRMLPDKGEGFFQRPDVKRVGTNWLNHLIYSLVLVVVYRRCKKG